MSQPALQPIPLGRSKFSALRSDNAVYVDKTEMLYNLCRTSSKVFLARPRRFGKSLLVSTFESLFKHGIRDFAGLAIEKLWSDTTYKVVSLDFSQIQDYESPKDFEEQFLTYVHGVFRDSVGYDGKADLIDLSLWLSKQPDNSIVLLIDEYDAPLTISIHQPEVFDKIQRTLNQFFSKIKANEGCLRFFFMTGITKYANTGIFSGFNNIDDISLSVNYGTILGYTEEELSRNFSAHLMQAAKTLGSDVKEVIEQLRKHYDGFSFDRKGRTHVYCPWSVLKFLKAPADGFLNYWCQNAKPTALMQYLRLHPLDATVMNEEKRGMSLNDLDSSLALPNLTLENLLLQTGYYTIKKELMPGYVEIGYPNQEVSISMAQLYADELLRNKNKIALGIPTIASALEHQSLDEIVRLFNNMFNGIDYGDYSIINESMCRVLLQFLLHGAAMLPHVEVHSAHGRSDLEVDAKTRRWVFEIKFARTEAEELKLLEEGKAQMTDRRYGETPMATGMSLHRAVLVFSKDKRRFVQWATC